MFGKNANEQVFSLHNHEAPNQMPVWDTPENYRSKWSTTDENSVKEWIGRGYPTANNVLKSLKSYINRYKAEPSPTYIKRFIFMCFIGYPFLNASPEAILFRLVVSLQNLTSVQLPFSQLP